MTDAEKTVAESLSLAEIRKRWPGRPKGVKGEHYGIWRWLGPSFFAGTVAGIDVAGVHRHGELSFPESAFPELEELGFGFVRWAAA